MIASAATRDEDLRRLLEDAIEVQLAALKAGISFWSEWIEQTWALTGYLRVGKIRSHHRRRYDFQRTIVRRFGSGSFPPREWAAPPRPSLPGRHRTDYSALQTTFHSNGTGVQLRLRAGKWSPSSPAPERRQP